MASSWETKECHFTWNLEEIPKVFKIADRILDQIQNNIAETDFLKIEHLLFKAYLQSLVKKNVKDARKTLDEAKLEIEKRGSADVCKGYKSVELLNRMWIEKRVSNNVRVGELHEELKTIELEEKDRQVIDAVKAAALMRLGPVMFEINLKLFGAAHQAFPSNQDFLFGVAHITGQKMRFERPRGARYDDNLDQFLKDLMDEEKEYLEKLIKLEPDQQRYHLATSKLGLNLSRRDKPEDKEKALRLLEEAYENAPDMHEVCRNLIRFLKRTDLVRSISILETAISRQPARVENHHQLAQCYIEKAKQEDRKRLQPAAAKSEAEIWTQKALEELNECLRLKSSHFYALISKAKQLQHIDAADRSESPEDVYENMMQMLEDFTLDDKLLLYSDFAAYLKRNESASRYSSISDIRQEVMNMSSDDSFVHQNESGKWEIKTKQKQSKTEAYKALKTHYISQVDRLKLGILFYQNFEFDQAIETLATVEDQTNAEVPYYLAKTYLKKGQEKTVGDQAKPEEAAGDFATAREKVELARRLGLEPQKVRKILADTALAIAHNELQVNVTSVIRLEDRCVTSYREAVRCGSLVAGLELMKLVNSIEITSRSRFIQMLAEIKLCCSHITHTASNIQHAKSIILHAESKPLTFEESLRSKETDIEPSMLKNLNKIIEDIDEILSKSTFFQKVWKVLLDMEVQLLQERFRGTDGLQLDGREEVLLEDVNETVIDKAVGCCCETRPLLDRIMETFQKDELGMAEVKKNYFPLILEENLTPEETEELLLDKLKILKIDMKTHYPKLFDYLLKLSPNISAENCFLATFFTLVNKTKHSNEDVLDIEPNPVKLVRQSIDKVEEVCNVFFHTMEEVKTLRTRVEDLASALRQSGRGEVEKAEVLFGLLENGDVVVRMDNTWKFLGMLALIRHCREVAGADVDLTRWTELSQRNGVSKEVREGYLEVEAALLTNGGNQSSMEVLEKCHTTCIEADTLLNKSLQSEGNKDTTNFPFPDIPPGRKKASWKGKVKQHLKKVLGKQEISNHPKLLDLILEAQPCSNKENYHFKAMRKFLDDWSRGTKTNTVSIEKEPDSTESYDVLKLTRWCVNHAEKLASEVRAHLDLKEAQVKK